MTECGWLCVCVCLWETIAMPFIGPAFSISWAHLQESIHTVIKCFESMFWIIFSNGLRAIKLPPDKPDSEDEGEREQRSRRQRQQMFSVCDKCSPHSEALCSPPASAKQRTLVRIWASHVYALSICTSHCLNVGPTIEWWTIHYASFECH